MRKLVVLAVIAGALCSTSAAAAKSSPLTGQFRVTLKGSISVLNGVWLMNIASNGAYTITKEPTTTLVLIGGVSTVSGHTLTLTDKSGSLACKGAQARGTYSFTLSGKTLALKVMNDKCTGRAAVLATSHFTKTH